MKKKTLVTIFVLLAGALLGGMGGGYLALTHDLPQIRSLENFQPESVTRIYSSDKILLSELFSAKRDPVPLASIPSYLINATITTEDRKFYRHSGVDLKGVARAIIKDILAGGFVEGASTITQQLAKTLFLTPRKTLTRKLKEALLAFQLERRYTKSEILQLYLNQIYFGSGAYGVEAAAQIYFRQTGFRPDCGRMRFDCGHAPIALTLFTESQSGPGAKTPQYRPEIDALCRASHRQQYIRSGSREAQPGPGC